MVNRAKKQPTARDKGKTSRSRVGGLQVKKETIKDLTPGAQRKVRGGSGPCVDPSYSTKRCACVPV